MSTVYWIYKNGHQQGPFTLSKIQGMWNVGTISLNDQIRRMDQQEWRAVSVMSRHLKLGRNESAFAPRLKAACWWALSHFSSWV